MKAIPLNKRIIRCSQCNKNNEIVAFEVLKMNSKLDVLMPVCERCAEKLSRMRA